MLKEKMKFPLRLGRKFYGYLKKDLMLFYNRKKYFYVFLLFPIIVAGLFLFMLSPTTTEISVGICDFDRSAETQQVLGDLESFDPILFEEEDCVDNLKDEIRRGDLALGLVIEEGFSSNIENLEQATITTYYDNTDIAFSNVVAWRVDSSLNPYKRNIIDELNEELKRRVSIARQSLGVAKELSEGTDLLHRRIVDIDDDMARIEELNTDFLINPINTDKRGVHGEFEIKYISVAFLFPIVSLFLILMLASISVIYDDKIGFITKVKTSTTIVTYILSKIIFFFILSTIIFGILYAIFLIAGAPLSFSLLEIVKLILLVSITNSMLGLLIGKAAGNEGVAILMSLFVSFPLMLLSGLFFPLQNMPSFIQSLIKILPLHYQIEATKSIILFNQTLSWTLVYATIPLFLFTIYIFRTDI